MPRHMLDLEDLGDGGIVRTLDAADRWLEERGSAAAPAVLAGKSVALVFEKASTRTRISLEVAVSELGGHPLVITSSTSQMGRGEPLADTSRVLSRMVHAITFRTFGHDRLRELAKYSSRSVINTLSDSSHPMQILADLQTVRRVRGKLDGLKYVWVGDGNNMANSWIEAAGLLGLDLTVACPEGHDPDPAYLAAARARGGRVEIVRDPAAACDAADVINTDVFASMGQEEEQVARLATFSGYCVTREFVARAANDVMVLHCLPAHRGEEIEAEVIDGPHSHVWDQAEARLHTSKAVLAWALEGE